MEVLAKEKVIEETVLSGVEHNREEKEKKSISFREKSLSKQNSLRTLLNLSSQRLFGRDEEEAQLVEAYQRAMTSSICELVLISGLSGTGKTTLAHNTLRKQPVHVITGKFEETKQPPFAVFVQALTEYAERTYDAYPNRIPMLKEEINNMVSEGGLLTGLIPSLTKIMGPQPPSTLQDASSRAARFRYVFSRLIKAIATVHPLVILFDDIAWADDASLESIQALLLLQEKDKPLPLMVVCTHRPLDGTSSVSKLLRRLDSQNVTEICLTDWNVDLVNQFVSDLLQHGLEVTLPLAQLVHSQTQGNIFYVMQYLKFLEEQGLIYYDSSIDEWRWDLDELESKSAAELMNNKLEQLPSEVRRTLEVAACMGNIIDDSALLIILDNRELVASSLDQAADAGLLVCSQDHGYKFAHDRIRQAILTLLDDPDQFRLDIGRKLWNHVNDDSIFVVVTLLNRGSSLIELKEERYRLAKLNLKAGVKAASLSSFPDAAFYLNSGIDLLGRHHWEEEYKLSLELHDTAAEVEMCNANFERVRGLITQVLMRAMTLQDKLCSYVTLMRSVGQQDDLEEAMTIGFDVLRALGDPLPRKASKWASTKDLVRTKWMMRNMTVEDFCSIPLMTNGNKIWCSEILNILSVYSVLTRSPFVDIISLRTIQLCIRYGLSRGSSWAFAFYGMAFVSRGNVKEGARMARVALAVLEASGAHEMLPRVYLIVYSGVLHWTRPLRETLEPLKFASRVAMETGDVEHSMLCVNRYCVHGYFSGRPLSRLEDEFDEYAHQMKMYKQENVLISFNLLGQLIHNLTGRSDEPTVLRGEIMDIDHALKEAKETHSASHENSCLQFSAYAAYLFGDYERAHELEEKIEQTKGATLYFWGRVQVCFIRGLAAIAVARTKMTNREKYMKIGRASYREMLVWAKNCPSNFKHKQKLLEAELKGVAQDAYSPYVVASYDEAVEGARREGIIHDEALACERAAEYMERVNDPRVASAYRFRAQSLYLEWGATAKASMLMIDSTNPKEAKS